MRRSLSLSAAGFEREDVYAADLHRRQVELVASLLHSAREDVTYDLRIISEPDAELPSRGTIRMAILCRVDAEASHAAEHARQLKNLMTAYIPEHHFELASGDEVARWLQPFPIEHLFSLHRRVSLEDLDSLRGSVPARQVGFGASIEQRSVPRAAVLHIHPFLPSQAGFENIFQLLMLSPHPVALSVRLRPTSLLEEEEVFLERQIETCERYAQMPPADIRTARSDDDPSWIRPALREQARLYQNHLTRLLFELRDNAGILTVEIASQAPVPRLLADSIGGLLSEPSGGVRGGDEGLLRTLSGGYQLVEATSEGERQAFRTAEMSIPRLTNVPDGARRIPYLFDAVEAKAAFRLPPARPNGLPGIEWQEWKEAPPPRNLPDRGVIVGLAVDNGTERPVRLASEDRLRHTYVVGQTGTGKTTLLKSMILSDIEAGEGLCVIDPHGDLFRELLAKIPDHRINDVVVFDPTDTEAPVGLNLFEYEMESQRYFLVQELSSMISRLMEDEYGAQGLGMLGPMFFQHVRMNALLTMSDPENPGTLFDFYNIFSEKDYWRRWLPLQLTDPMLERWVEHVLPKIDYSRQNSDGVTFGNYISSKFEGFLFDPLLRGIFAPARSTIDLRDIMDSGKILLINLAKGDLSDANSRFLGMVMLARIQATAMARSRTPRLERREFHLYVDEFQSIATQSFVVLLSEARKFGVSMILANQFLSQIKDERIQQAIMANAGTKICFRLGLTDAERIERELLPVVSRYDLINLPNWRAYISTLVDGQATRPFALQTPQPRPFERRDATAIVRTASRAKYGQGRIVRDVDIPPVVA